MAEVKYYVDNKKLNKLLKAFDKVPLIKVGIMGDDNSRTDGLSNATIGAIHEFGFGRVPMRSFLRVPLVDNLNTAIEEQLDVKIDAVVEGGSLQPLMKKIALIAEQVVLNAFDTQGNGKWPKWIDPGYMNNTGQILVDTQQLRNSITSTVSED